MATPPQQDWLTEQLYQPYTTAAPPGVETSEKDDRNIRPVGHNLNEIYLGIVFAILFFTFVLIIFNGFIYEKFFKKERDTEAEYLAKGNTEAEYKEYRDNVKGELRDHPTMYWGSSMIAIAFITIFLGIALIVYWMRDINPTLRRENVIGRDIAVAMRVGDSVKNTSDLLASYVHPLKDQGEKREKLSSNLNQALGNAIRVEQNVTRAKYLPGRSEASYGYNQSAIDALSQGTYPKSAADIEKANEAAGRAMMAREGLGGAPLGPASWTPEQITQLEELNKMGRAFTKITPGGKKSD